ncbi:MAG: adenylate/guanylate cyclase domain-containing protein [Planctomycetota bacterium]
MAFLIRKGAEDTTESIPLIKSHFTIGRAPNNDFIIIGKQASREHAKIEEVNNRHVLSDLGSSNGSFINNHKVEGKTFLNDGDIIKIGEIEFTYSSKKGIAHLAHDSDEVYATQIVKPVSAVRTMTTQQLSPTPSFTTTQFSQNFMILYQIGHLLNSARNVSELLDTALNLVFKVIKADRGTVMLLDTDNISLVPRITKSRKPSPTGEVTISVSKTIAQKAIKEKVSILSADATADPRFSCGESIVFQNIRSVLCVPLCDEENVVTGIIYVDNLHEPNIFSENDLDLLTAVANQVAVAIKKEDLHERLRREAILRSSLEKYNSREVVNMIVNQLEKGGTAALDMREAEVSILFADLVSFTPLCETMSPSDVATRLSEYFERMSAVIFTNSGMINKYIGDAILVVFGAFSDSTGADEATAAAAGMLKALKELRDSDKRFEQFHVKIGVNTGLVVLGNIGPLDRIEYTVIGDVVNVASRLQSIAQPDTALIGDGTYNYVKTKFPSIKYLGETALKGKTGKTKVYEIPLV